MTIDEAIEIKEKVLAGIYCGTEAKFKEADKLSIEALKRYKEQWANSFQPPHRRLPGETEE